MIRFREEPIRIAGNRVKKFVLSDQNEMPEERNEKWQS